MKNILVIGDCHARPGVSNRRFTALGRFIVDKQPDIVVCIGDFAEMSSLCTYDKGTYHSEGRRYSQDLSVANNALECIDREMIGMDNRPEMYMLLGNHEERINRAGIETPELYGHLSTDDIYFKFFGWTVIPFLVPLVIQGITFQHYFTPGQMGRPIDDERRVLRTQHASCVYGHNHRKQYYAELNAYKKKIFAYGCGCFDEGTHSYTRESNRWDRGLTILYEAHNGFASMGWWELDYVKRKYL